MDNVPVFEILIAGALLAVPFVALECGFRIGQRASKAREAISGSLAGPIQGATLGLLGLLLGFSFAGAAGRFMERQDQIIREANAIGTASLRAELLDAPHRDALRAALREYVSHRVQATEQIRFNPTAEVLAEVDEKLRFIWDFARQGVEAKPSVGVLVLNPVNEVIDLHAMRVATGRKHLPALVLVLLVVSSIVAIGMIGYACGTAKKRAHAMTLPLALLISVALWTIIDLDYPRIGLIQLDDRPLLELHRSLSR